MLCAEWFVQRLSCLKLYLISNRKEKAKPLENSAAQFCAALLQKYINPSRVSKAWLMDRAFIPFPDHGKQTEIVF